MRWMPLLLLFLQGLLLGCVGPMTPFGASMNQAPKSFKNGSVEDVVEIAFYPKRQVYHGINKLEVVIRDPFPAEDELVVSYNKLNITHLAKIETHSDHLQIKFSKALFHAEKNHDVTIRYKGVQKKWQRPVCEDLTLISTYPFEIEVDWMRAIHSAGEAEQISSAMLAALIAQESSFNPNAISWAKAIGLTQITNLADEDLKPYSKKWPRNKATRRYPASALKRLIKKGEINQSNEWRLDPKHSIVGGAKFLRKIKEYWSKEENQKLLQEIPVHRHIDVILASYNSGNTRVKKAIKRDKDQFLNKLNAARHYVERIKSYCFHFSQENKDYLVENL